MRRREVWAHEGEHVGGNAGGEKEPCGNGMREHARGTKRGDDAGERDEQAVAGEVFAGGALGGEQRRICNYICIYNCNCICGIGRMCFCIRTI